MLAIVKTLAFKLAGPLFNFIKQYGGLIGSYFLGRKMANDKNKLKQQKAKADALKGKAQIDQDVKNLNGDDLRRALDE